MYRIELWRDMLKVKEFETEDYELAKKKYCEFEKEEGTCSFYIDGKGMSIKWMCENLLGLDYDKIEADRVAKIEEIKSRIERTQ